MTEWIRRQLNSLAVRLLWPAALMMVVMVVTLMTVVTRTYTDRILEQEAAKTQAAFGVMANSVASIADNARTLGQNMSQLDVIQRYAADEFASDADRVAARRELIEDTGMMLLQNPDVYGLLFMRRDATVFGILPYRNYFLEDEPPEFVSEEFFARVSGLQRGQTEWIGPVSGRTLYQLGEFDKAPGQVMLGVSYNRSLEGGILYSIAVVEEKKLSGLLDLQSDGRSSFFITSSDGVPLASSGGGAPLAPEVWAAAEGGSLGSRSVEAPDGESSHVSWRRIDPLNWYLVRELPMAEYDRTANELKHYVLLTALSVFAVALLVYMIWMGGFLRSFRALRSAIRRLGEGRLETRIERPFNITEFEEIRREFNDMNRDLERLMQTTRAMERDRLELEMRALQTQLSPHMIFNSITAIRWMATMLGADRVSDMLMELSEMLRPVFRDWAIEWTLGEELDHLSHYAKLLDLRYGNNFSLSVDVPEQMHALRLPRFTLQPLIENSCEHGGAVSARLNVSVSAWTEGGRAVIAVRDDGAGIEPGHLEEINRRLAEDRRENVTKRVGLYNVCNRLRICMGDGSRMTVASLPEGGTQVLISWEIGAESYEIKN